MKEGPGRVPTPAQTQINPRRNIRKAIMTTSSIYRHHTPQEMAEELAEQGLYVFPVTDKRPLLKWRDNSSRTPDALSWAGANGVGIDCGKSGLGVVDYDPGHTPLDIPHTLTQATPRGGSHLFYRDRQGVVRNSAGKLGQAIDTRGVGGFVVWYNTANWDWEEVEEWPQLLSAGGLTAIDPTPRPEEAKEGSRNNTLAEWAGTHCAQNGHRPWESVRGEILAKGLASGLSAQEIERTVLVSAQTWWAKARAKADISEEEKEALKGAYFGPIGGLPVQEPPRKLAGDWLREASYTLLYSRAGVGKTAFLVDLVRRLKRGDKFMRQDTADPGKVLWVNGDMPTWQVHERLSAPLDGMVDLWQVEMVNLLNHEEELLEKCKGYGLVVFDNRSCLFQMEDGNKAESWTPLNHLMRRVANLGCANILATHEGKGEGTSSFGSSAQEWHTDTIIRLSRFDFESHTQKWKEANPEMVHFTRKATFQKCRLGPEMEPQHFRIQPCLSETGLLIGGVECDWG